MSKNLEEEYKSMIAQDIPDIWDRIENALPEKVSVQKENSQEDKVVSFKKWYQNKKIITMCGTFAAACLAIAIIVPTVFATRNAKKNDAIENSKALVNADISEKPFAPADNNGAKFEACDEVSEGEDDRAMDSTAKNDSIAAPGANAADTKGMDENAAGVKKEDGITNVEYITFKVESVEDDSVVCEVVGDYGQVSNGDKIIIDSINDDMVLGDIYVLELEYVEFIDGIWHMSEK